MWIVLVGNVSLSLRCVGIAFADTCKLITSLMLKVIEQVKENYMHTIGYAGGQTCLL